MKFTLIFAIALFTIAHADDHIKELKKSAEYHGIDRKESKYQSKHLRKSVCYYKVQKCCFKYEVCHHNMKEIKYYKPFSYKKVEQKCAQVPRIVWKNKCKDVVVYKKPKYCRHGNCKPVKEMKKKCCDYPVTEYVNKCKEIYKTVKAYKIFTQKVKYTKYCAKAECGKGKTVGNWYKPKPYSKYRAASQHSSVVHKKPVHIKEHASQKN